MYMKNKKNRSKKSKNKFYRIISALLIIVSIIFSGILIYLDLIPNKYILALIIAIAVFDLINVALLNISNVKMKVKKILVISSMLAVLVMSVGIFNLYRTISVLAGNGDGDYKIENYSVVVLKDSKYDTIEDIKNKRVGYYKNSIGADESLKTLKNKVKAEMQSYDSASLLELNLFNKNIDAILVEDSIMSILGEENSSFDSSTKVIYTFKIKVKVESTLKDTNVTQESFAVYVSGIDTYGQIASVSRSDVNIVMVVNPKTKQILLISIPRDYYVQLHGTTGRKDKLTHAGIYGIDMSIKTVEDLLKIEINYYIKVNFTSVIDIVEALGGLDVYSEYTFTSYSGYSFKKGYNSVNGEQALDFARTRKAFVDGDRQRGKNQQALIEALVRKASSKSIITKYNSLLNAIDGKYQTNMSMKKITSLVKMQLNDMASWNVTSYSLTGSDSKNYTYTSNQLLYVMEPDEDSLNEASNLINEVLGDKKLDSSYNEVQNSSNKVTKANTITTNENSSKNDKEMTDEDKTDKRSTDATLKYLNIEGYDIEFDKNTSIYNLTIEEDVNSLNVEAKPSDPNATYEIKGTSNLKQNGYKVLVEVTAENGNEKVYIINLKINSIKEATDVENKTEENEKNENKVNEDENEIVE